MTIYPKTLDFLRKLSKNNNRDWFEKNRPEYETAKENFAGIVQELITALGKLNPALKGIQNKDCIFRIYRDVRFSKNKEPYKTNFGAYMVAGGKKSELPGFYLQVQPGGSFAAGGCWMPEGPKLKAIRQEIQYHTKEFKKIINNKTFINSFGMLSDEKLKTAPKGFAKDDPDLELYKYKSYIVVHKFSDKEVLAKDFISQNAGIYKAMQPMLTFLEQAIS